ncbi:MAG: hypothetical protein AAGK05_00085 [Pseudomonadota bacterium]
MSFYHVLASNVSPQTFPNNHASKFSTPLDHPYEMKGKHEVSIMNMTYTGCVNTFNNDEIRVEKAFTLKEMVQTSDRPIRINFTGKTILSLFDEIKRKLSGVVKLEFAQKSRYCTWSVQIPNVNIILSRLLAHHFKLFQDVITRWDVSPSNYYPFKADKILPEGEDYHIIIIPPSYNKTTVTLKKANEGITREEFVKRFKEQLHQYLSIQVFEQGNKYRVDKLYDDNTAVIFSSALHLMTNFRQAGLYAQYGNAQYAANDFNNAFKPSWKVFLFQTKDVQLFMDKMSITVTLPPHVFQHHNDAVVYLNKNVNNSNISFSLDKNNILLLKIKDRNTSVTFSNTLRDIFAFDKNRYSGIGNYRSSDVFSLTRRIQFLYVYSNISDYVRVGNTEVPLLAVIPFESSKTCDSLVEKTFSVPMYVSVARDFISQIDIYIYDGSGELIPFVEQAVTSIRLHYRRV